MLVYSKTCIRNFILGFAMFQPLMFYALQTLAQEGAISSPSTTVQGAEVKQPVPMLEAGEYTFEDGEGLGSAAAVPVNPVNEYDIGSDAFYDADAILPEGKVGKAGPAPVDPKKNPASKLLIVESVTPGDNKSTKLVAADRAMSLGRYDSALQLYDDLYAKNPKDTAVLMGRAVCLQKLARFDEAMQTYEDLSKLQPDNVEVKINMLGLLATRYPSVALRRLLDLYESNEQNVGIVAQIAVTSANLGDFEMAMKYLGLAMSMQPENAGHVYNAAVILDRAGKTKEAIAYYEKALEVDSIYGGSRSVPRDIIYERLSNIR